MSSLVFPLNRLWLAIRWLCALPYVLCVCLRNWAYDYGLFRVYHSTLPVVSIGNISVGGNGKTPLCIYLCQRLQERGWRPVLLTRGYGGTVRGVHRIGSQDSADVVGDEALLLARRTGAEVVVCPRRAEGATYVEQHALGDIILLDDGLQHRALARDFEIISVNATGPRARRDFKDAVPLPLGRFRELKGPALRRAHAVVVASRAIASEGSQATAFERLPPALSVHFSALNSSGLVPLAEYLAGQRQSAAAPPPRGCVAFCGLAQPQGFFESIRALGIVPQECRAYPDHFRFQQSDLQLLQKAHPGCFLVCSEKDAVKLTSQQPAELWVLCVELTIEPQGKLLEELLAKVGTKLTGQTSPL